MEAEEALVLAKSYTKNTVKGLGAIKGKNCTIQNTKFDADGNSIVTFGWTDDDGTLKTTDMMVSKGVDGKDADLTNLKSGENIIIKDNGDGTITISASGEMSIDYSKATNKPSINGVELDGNKTTADLKIESGKIDVIKVNGTEQAIVDKAVDITVPTDYVKKDGTKVLSTNDYDNDSKSKVDAIPENPKYTDTVYDDTEIREGLHDLSYNEIAGGKNLANDILFDEPKYILRDTTWSYIDVSSILARKKFTASMKDNPNLTELNCGFGTDSTVDPVVANRFITGGNIKSVTYDFSTSDKVYLFVATAGGYISTKLNKMLNALSTRLQVEIGDTATDYEQHIKSNATLTNEISRKELELAELKMLGWTVPKECPIQNTVSGNTFTQRVGRVDLGSLNWGINAYATPTAFSLHENIDLPDLVSISDNKEENVRCYSPNYDCDSAGKVTGTTRTYTFCVITGKRLYVRADVTTAEELKAELKGKYIYYELETPITKQIDGNEKISEINATMDKVDSIPLIYNQNTDILAYALTCSQAKRTLVRIHSANATNNPFGVTGDTDFIYEISKVDSANNWISVKAKDVRTNREFLNTKNDVAWLGWQELSTRTVVKDYEITVSANSVGQINLDSSQTNNLFAVANIPYNGTDGFANVEPSLIYVRNLTSQERLFKIKVIAFF